MTNTKVLNNPTTRRILLIACVIALAMAFLAALPRPASADVTPPPVPDNIKVPEGNKLFLVGHATGTQNYVCLPTSSGIRFVLFTPQATLFDEADKQIITHYFSPNPNPDDPNTDPKVVANGAIRPTWQDKDTSKVWAKMATGGSSPAPEPGAVAWLLLEAVGHEDGPTGGNKLSVTTYIQRLNTTGGVAPSTGCATSENIGTTAIVPYTADYFFYKAK